MQEWIGSGGTMAGDDLIILDSALNLRHGPAIGPGQQVAEPIIR